MCLLVKACYACLHWRVGVLWRFMDKGTAESCCGQGTVKKKVCRMALSHPSGTTLSQCSPSVRLWRRRGLVPISGEGDERNWSCVKVGSLCTMQRFQHQSPLLCNFVQCSTFQFYWDVVSYLMKNTSTYCNAVYSNSSCYVWGLTWEGWRTVNFASEVPVHTKATELCSG